MDSHASVWPLELGIRTLHMVRGNTYLHMYGLHLHRRTMMIRMLWVMMGMSVHAQRKDPPLPR